MYKCLTCNTTFKELPSKYSSGNFCSRKCANIFSSNTNLKVRCKKVSNTMKGKLSGAALRYKGKFRKTLLPRIGYCEICNKEIIYKQNVVKACSRECSLLLISQKMIGVNSGSKNGMFGKARRNSNYNKGKYNSKRFEIIVPFRSSYEKKVLELFEEDFDIEWYKYEKLAIPYQNGNRNTIPDFEVKLKDGRYFIVEIKPNKLLTYWNNKEKIEAIKVYCKQKNINFKIISEKDLTTKIRW